MFQQILLITVADKKHSRRGGEGDRDTHVDVGSRGGKNSFAGEAEN